MIVNLTTPFVKVIQQEITQTISSLTIKHINDYPEDKKVICFVKELSTPITLWEGLEYDTIGQWTDVDVVSRLNVIYNQNSSQNTVSDVDNDITNTENSESGTDPEV